MTRKELFKSLQDFGFVFIEYGKNYKFRSPKGKMLVVSGTPRCKWGWNHAITDAKKIIRSENELDKKTLE